MVGEILGLFLNPITTIKEKTEEKNIKKEAIIALVLAVVIALVTMFSTYITVVKAINKVYKSVDDYNDKYSWKDDITKSEFKELKKKAKEQALDAVDFTEMFFKTAGKAIAAIAVVGAMLYVISRLMKNPIDFVEVLAISNRAFMIFGIGYLLMAIFILIYIPIGVILFISSILYAFLVVACAFREKLGTSDLDRLNVIAGIVITVVIAALVLIIKEKLGDITGLF